MTYADDRPDHGGGFIAGFLAGTMLGAGLGLLFAPKPGADLRKQISDHAETIGQSASEGYRRASDAAGTMAGKGRDAYGKVREIVSRGTEEARRYMQDAREATATDRETVGGSSEGRLG
jgi:gas vesicle protein